MNDRRYTRYKPIAHARRPGRGPRSVGEYEDVADSLDVQNGMANIASTPAGGVYALVEGNTLALYLKEPGLPTREVARLPASSTESIIRQALKKSGVIDA